MKGGWLVQGWNGIICEWETLPYQTEDMQVHHLYPIEYMAVSSMRAMAELWGGEYRVIRSGEK